MKFINIVKILGVSKSIKTMFKHTSQFRILIKLKHFNKIYKINLLFEKHNRPFVIFFFELGLNGFIWNKVETLAKKMKILKNYIGQNLKMSYIISFLL